MGVTARIESKPHIKITPNEQTRSNLMTAHMALWAINLRYHRGDDQFRDEVHRLRDETAILIEALDASEEPSEPG